jgi:hypothetical protein
MRLELPRVPSSVYSAIGLALVPVLASFFMRISVVGTFLVPPGVDTGNWLTRANILIGQDVAGRGLEYPPLFFLILNGFRMLFDDFWALKILGALSSALPGIPFFFLAREFCRDRSAFVGAVLFTFAEGISEMMAWGGYPQLLGMFFATASFLFAVRALRRPTRLNLSILALTTSLVAGTHHFTIVYLLLAYAFFGLLLMTKHSITIKALEKIAWAGILTFALTIPYLGVYREMFVQAQGIYLPPVSLSWNDLTYVFRYGLWTWSSIAIASAIGCYLWLRRRHFIPIMLTSATVLAMVTIAYTVPLPDASRPFYFAYLPMCLAFCVFVDGSKPIISSIRTPGSIRKSVLGVSLLFYLVFSCTILGLYSYQRMLDSTRYYAFVGNDELEAFRWIRDNTSRDSLIATSGSDKVDFGASYGWWMTTLSQRGVFFTGDPRWFILADERKSVEAANLMFGANETLARSVILERHVGYLLLNKGRTTEYYRIRADEDCFELVFENSSTAVFRVRACYGYMGIPNVAA